MKSVSSSSRRLLIVGDPLVQQKALLEVFADEGFEVFTCATAEDAVELCESQTFGVAILDLLLDNLPEVASATVPSHPDGLALLRRLQSRQPAMRTIVHTSRASFDSAKDAINSRTVACVEKGCDPRELVNRVHHAANEALSEALAESEQRYQDLLYDITDGRLAVEALPESESQGQHAEEIALMTLHLSLEGTWLKVPHRFCERLGYSREELLHRPASEFTHPDDRAEGARQLQRLLAGEIESFEWEQRLLRKDGKIVWSYINCALVADGNDQPLYLKCYVKDITQQKVAGEALLASESRHRSLVQSAPLCIHEVDLDGRLESINPAGVQMVDGSCEAALVGRDYLSFVQPCDRPRIEALLKSAYQGESSSFIFRCRVKEEERLFASNFIPIFNESGVVTKLMGTTEDVTERRKAEASLRGSEERFRQLAENINAVFWMRSADGGEQLYVSPKFEEIWGRDREPDNRVPASFFDVVIEEDRPQLLAAFEKLRNGGSAEDYDIEYRIRRPDGELRWIHDRGFSICDEQGNVIRQAGFAEDVTGSRKALEQVHIRGRAISSANVGIVISDVTLKNRPIVYCNPAFEQLTGYSKDELVGRSCGLLWAGDEDQGGVRSLGQAVTNARECSTVIRCYTKDREMFWDQVSISPVHDRGGRLTHFVGFHTNISDIKKTEEALRIRDRAIAATTIGIIIADATNKDRPVVYCNDAFVELTGYSHDEVIGENCRMLQAGDRDQEGVRALRRAVAEGRECTSVVRNYRKDGTMFWNEVSVSPIYGANGEITHFVGFQNDITLRVEANAKLRESENRFRTIFEQAAVGVALIETQSGRFVRVNQKYADMIGYSTDEMTQLTFMDLTYPDDLESDLENMRRLHAGEIAEYSMEKRLVRKDGKLRWVNLTVSPTWQKGATPRFHIAIVQDVTEQKEAESRLLASEARFRALVENSYDVISMFSATGELLYVSPSVEHVLGYHAEEMKSLSLADLIHPADFEEASRGFMECAQTPGSGGHFRHRLKHKDGSYRTVEVAGMNLLEEPGVHAMVSIFRDITERRLAEEQLRERETQLAHVSRLSTMGEMVAGIAHEINQPLSAIANFSLATLHAIEAADYEFDFPIEEWLDNISRQAAHCGDIIRRLRNFVRKGDDNREWTNLNNVIRESVALIKSDTRHNSIAIDCCLLNEETLVNINAIQLQQVLVNLLRNACDATSETVAPRINIHVFRDDDRVRLTVADNGRGVEEIQRQQLFNAFYTTKPDGMGMGLAISKSIIEAHGGKLRLDTEASSKTTFHIELPKNEWVREPAQ